MCVSVYGRKEQMFMFRARCPRRQSGGGGGNTKNVKNYVYFFTYFPLHCASAPLRHFELRIGTPKTNVRRVCVRTAKRTGGQRINNFATSVYRFFFYWISAIRTSTVLWRCPRREGLRARRTLYRYRFEMDNEKNKI